MLCSSCVCEYTPSYFIYCVARLSLCQQCIERTSRPYCRSLCVWVDNYVSTFVCVLWTMSEYVLTSFSPLLNLSPSPFVLSLPCIPSPPFHSPLHFLPPPLSSSLFFLPPPLPSPPLPPPLPAVGAASVVFLFRIATLNRTEKPTVKRICTRPMLTRVPSAQRSSVAL